MTGYVHLLVSLAVAVLLLLPSSPMASEIQETTDDQLGANQEQASQDNQPRLPTTEKELKLLEGPKPVRGAAPVATVLAFSDLGISLVGSILGRSGKLSGGPGYFVPLMVWSISLPLTPLLSESARENPVVRGIPPLRVTGFIMTWMVMPLLYVGGLSLDLGSRTEPTLWAATGVLTSFAAIFLGVDALICSLQADKLGLDWEVLRKGRIDEQRRLGQIRPLLGIRPMGPDGATTFYAGLSAHW